MKQITQRVCLSLFSVAQILQGLHGLLPVAVLSASIEPTVVMLLQHIDGQFAGRETEDKDLVGEWKCVL